MPMYIRFFKAEKSFNPSAKPSFSLRIRRKVAEGFAFQTLQTLQPTLQPRKGRIQAKWSLRKGRLRQNSRWARRDNLAVCCIKACTCMPLARIVRQKGGY